MSAPTGRQLRVIAEAYIVQHTHVHSRQAANALLSTIAHASHR